jgi:hypothetical protein
VNMTSDDVLPELDEMKGVAVLDPAYVRGALPCCKGLMMFVECILDEFDKSELPFTGRRSWRPCSTRLRK